MHGHRHLIFMNSITKVLAKEKVKKNKKRKKKRGGGRGKKNQVYTS